MSKVRETNLDALDHEYHGIWPRSTIKKRVRRSVAFAMVFVMTCMLGGCASLSPPSYMGSTPQDPPPTEPRLIALPTGSIQVWAPTRSWRSLQQSNIVMQRYDYSCGAAALATVLHFYLEDDVTERDVMKAIFDAIKKSKDPDAELQDRYEKGFSLFDLFNASKHLGYRAAVTRLSLSILIEKVKMPVVVRIDKEDFEHFVVLRGQHEDRIYLADPIRGNIRMPIDEFIEQWNGISLVVDKPNFKPPPNHALAVQIEGPARPELEFAREAIFPPRR